MMSFEYFDKDAQARNKSISSYVFLKREELYKTIEKKKYWDLLVVGGGIHGAAFARIAAFNGLSTLLVEKHDYAFATSSRSSKMAHGGLRYLEMFDFFQVFEGIKAREDLILTAPHLVYPYDFMIPVFKKQNIFKFKLGLGLWLYDLFLKEGSRKHKWLPKDSFPSEMKDDLYPDLQGAYLYSDGIMNDSRVVIENILAARQEGAVCLNYTAFDSYAVQKDGSVEVGLSDCVTKEKYETKVGIVVNCAGPWVPYAGRVKASPVLNRLRYSQGIHLLFDKKWTGPARFLPLDEKGRYYFIWPHFAGTLVGTTEREIETLEEDPLAKADKIEKVLRNLAKDLPSSGLNRDSLHYCYAGIRALPMRSSTHRATSKVSRKHIWHHSEGMLSLLGGKFTTASWTVYEGIKRVYELANIKTKVLPIRGRKLPGAGGLESNISEFRRVAKERSIPEQLIERAIARLGTRVALLLEKDSYLENIADTLLRGEVEIAIDIEQAESLEDLMRRRLDLEYEAGHGIQATPRICEILCSKRPALDYEEEISTYQERMTQIQELIKKER